MRALRREPTSALLRRRDQGAEVLEFAVIAPALLLLALGLAYALYTAGAQVSLAHATSVGARYAAIPVDMVAGTYPSASAIASKVESSTPFFSSGACVTTIGGVAGQNVPVTVSASCSLPNPAAGALNGMMHMISGSGTFASTLTLTARAESRRE